MKLLPFFTVLLPSVVNGGVFHRHVNPAAGLGSKSSPHQINSKASLPQQIEATTNAVADTTDAAPLFLTATKVPRGNGGVLSTIDLVLAAKIFTFVYDANAILPLCLYPT